MDSMTIENWRVLSEAIVEWTGWGRAASPLRDDALLSRSLGSPETSALRAEFRNVVDAFYSSPARHVAADLEEMGDLAISQFRTKYPHISEDAAQALAWCYTYDYK